jgi:bifunctional DNA primase/polymerase-like protein/primase-like protein
MSTMTASPNTEQATVAPNVVPLMDNLSVALAHAAVGLRILPVRVYFDAAKSKWKKVPLIDAWPEKATTNPNTIRGWWKQWSNELPGIALDDLVVLDADRHRGGADGVTAFAELVVRYKELKPHPICETAGDGEHHYFKQMPGFKLGNSPGGLPSGVDVRGLGGFVMAPGAMRPDGARWKPAGLGRAYVDGDIPIIPDWLFLLIHGPEEQQHEADKPKPNGERSKVNGKAHHDEPGAKWSAEEEGSVREALAVIHADDRSYWFRVGAALHSTGWSTARRIWDEWSATSAKFDTKDQDKTWDSFGRRYKRKPVKLASLFHLAIATQPLIVAVPKGIYREWRGSCRPC